jgi:hypothetical protein
MRFLDWIACRVEKSGYSLPRSFRGTVDQDPDAGAYRLREV